MLPNFMEKIVLYLPHYDIKLISEKTSLPSKKLIQIFSRENENNGKFIGTLVLDERDSTIVDGSNYISDSIVSEIFNKFKDFKRSNINYGTLGTSLDFEYTGTDYISVEKFFEYLKTENRNHVIESITK